MKKSSHTNHQWMHIGCFALVLGLAACGDKDTSQNAEKKTQGKSAQSQQSPSAEGANATSVNATKVERREMQAWIYSQGTARSRQREFLTFTQQGVVTYVDENLRVGRPVKKGQLIAHQAPERVQADFKAAQAGVAEAQANLALSEVTKQRYETLIEQKSASKQELDEATVGVQQAKAALDNARAQLAQAQLGVDESRLVSPINGVLARLNIEKGRYFMPNTVQTNTEQSALRTVPAMVIDANRFEVRVDLPSYDFRQIQAGAKAVVGSSPTTQAQDVESVKGAARVEGSVHAVSPSLDPETRTFEVVIHTDGINAGLQDGAFVAVWIAEPQMENALTVPLEALRYRNDQSFVFVVDEKTGKVAERRVEVGQQSSGYRVVMDGVREDELVVTDGRAALNDGQQVRVLKGGGSPQ